MKGMTQEEGCRLFLALSVIPYSIVRWFVFVGFTSGNLEINKHFSTVDCYIEESTDPEHHG